MSETNGNTPGERDEDLIVAAAEYALGLTTGEERRRAAERAGRDPAFAREVAYWQQRTSLLITEDEVAPPERVWEAVRARVGALEHAPRPRARPAAPAFWRWATMGAAGAALAAALALVIVLIMPSRQPLIATLTSEQGPHFMLVVEPSQATILASTVGAADTQGRVPELWLLPPQGDAISLGVIPREPGGARLSIPPRLAEQMHAGTKLAVSLEPPGGSPTGRPTGPVIAAAALTGL